MAKKVRSEAPRRTSQVFHGQVHHLRPKTRHIIRSFIGKNPPEHRDTSSRLQKTKGRRCKPCPMQRSDRTIHLSMASPFPPTRCAARLSNARKWRVFLNTTHKTIQEGCGIRPGQISRIQYSDVSVLVLLVPCSPSSPAVPTPHFQSLGY